MKSTCAICEQDFDLDELHTFIDENARNEGILRKVYVCSDCLEYAEEYDYT